MKHDPERSLLRDLQTMPSTSTNALGEEEFPTLWRAAEDNAYFRGRFLVPLASVSTLSALAGFALASVEVVPLFSVFTIGVSVLCSFLVGTLVRIRRFPSKRAKR